MEKQNNITDIASLPLQKRLVITFLRTFFKLLYHQLSWTYDWVASIVSLGAWQKWVQSVVPYLNGPRTLEIGFGPGHLQTTLIKKGISVFGLDESSQMARIAHRRINKLGEFSNLVRGTSDYLPFTNECFQQVVMTFPAEFIFNQPTFVEINRVLARGGEAVILPLAWITGRKPLQRAVAWFNQITGEAPEWDEKYLEPFKMLGFDVASKMINYSDSKVLIIQLTKHINY
jgi:ubiquinone/menaquinone biosynthesis C-methylase UbiE